MYKGFFYTRTRTQASKFSLLNFGCRSSTETKKRGEGEGEREEKVEDECTCLNLEKPFHLKPKTKVENGIRFQISLLFISLSASSHHYLICSRNNQCEIWKKFPLSKTTDFEGAVGTQSDPVIKYSLWIFAVSFNDMHMHWLIMIIKKKINATIPPPQTKKMELLGVIKEHIKHQSVPPKTTNLEVMDCWWLQKLKGVAVMATCWEEEVEFWGGVGWGGGPPTESLLHFTWPCLHVLAFT